MTDAPEARSDAAAFHAHSHGGGAFTGERVRPDEPGWQWCYQAHRFGYQDLLSRIPPGARVLDIGCGEGYGTAMIADRAGWTVGCDYAEDTVRHAHDKYRDASIMWVVCDAQRLPFRGDTFDVISSLQVIEHFTDTDAHLSGVSRALSSGGFHYCATPNIALATPEEADNEFHLRDFDAPALEAVMRSHFERVDLFGQYYREDSPRVLAMREADARIEADRDRTRRVEGLLARLPGPIRVRVRPLARRVAGLPAEDASAVRNQITADDFVARPPADGSFCLFAISQRPRH